MKCPGCNTEIPEGKNSCPMCGATKEKIYSDLGIVEVKEPVIVSKTYHQTVITPAPQVVTIEKTGKKWKKLYLYAWGFMFLGMVSCAGGTTDKSQGATLTSIIFWAIAIGLYIKARFGAWWNHG